MFPRIEILEVGWRCTVTLFILERDKSHLSEGHNWRKTFETVSKVLQYLLFCVP